MNYFKGITIGKDERGNEYKEVRLQKFLPSGKTKITNNFFINGKKVTRHERWECEQWIEENYFSRCQYTTEEW